MRWPRSPACEGVAASVDASSQSAVPYAPSTMSDGVKRRSGDGIACAMSGPSAGAGERRYGNVSRAVGEKDEREKDGLGGRT